METEREMSRYEVSPIGIFLETWDGSGGINRECLMPRDCFVEAYEKWIKNTTTEKNEAIEQEPKPKKGEWLRMSNLTEEDDDRYKCSRCGNVIHYKNKMDLYTFNSWCGRCGSDNGRHVTDDLIKRFEMASKECEAKGSEDK